MRRACLLLVLALTLLGPVAAKAEAPAPRDVATIDACLTKLDNGRATQAAVVATCLLKVADPCIGGDEGAVPDRKQIDCLDRERLVWDGIVNDSYKAVMAAVEPDVAAKLREAQRAWMRDRDLTCGFYYDFYQGTMARPMIAACTNSETARRAIFLRRFAAPAAPLPLTIHRRSARSDSR
jgi:uncharacterized protein YecT (DUF1311 family)